MTVESATNSTDGEPRVLEFDRLTIRWDRRVLEPRPWTAEQSHLAAAISHECPPGPILELCCGAGQIGLLAASLTGRDLVQVDRDPVAAEYARQNAETAGVRSDVRARPIDRALADDEVFPLVIADPPWVPSARVVEFPDDPVDAIDGGAEGTDLIRRCVAVALRHLSPEGWCVVQVGTAEQAEHVVEIVADHAAGPRHRVDSVRDCRPGGMLVLVGPQHDNGGASAGTVSEAYRDGGETVFPSDATAGYPLEGADVQEGTAGPNARPRHNDPAHDDPERQNDVR